MLEKLVQAATITFLLHLLATISPNTIESKAVLPLTEAVPFVTSATHSLR